MVKLFAFILSCLNRTSESSNKSQNTKCTIPFGCCYDNATSSINLQTFAVPITHVYRHFYAD